MLLLFGAFSLVLNISLPLHFENQARNALTYEINHMEQIRKSKKDDLSDVDEYVGTYFSGEIKFIELYDEKDIAGSYDDASESNVAYKENIQVAENEILAFEKENKLVRSPPTGGRSKRSCISTFSRLFSIHARSTLFLRRFSFAFRW